MYGDLDCPRHLLATFEMSINVFMITNRAHIGIYKINIFKKIKGVESSKKEKRLKYQHEGPPENDLKARAGKMIYGKGEKVIMTRLPHTR